MKRWIPAFAAQVALVAMGQSAVAAVSTASVDYFSSGTQWLTGREPAVATRVLSAPQLLSSSGKSSGHWLQRSSGPTGDFKRLWGRGSWASSEALRDPRAAEAAAAKWWSRNSALLPPGVRPRDLRIVSNETAHGIRLVRHAQRWQELTVFGATNFVAIAAGKVALVGTRSFPIPTNTARPLAARPHLTEAQARIAATQALAARGFGNSPSFAELGWLPIAAPDRYDFALCYRVGLQTSTGPFVAFVGAVRGELLALVDRRMLSGGTLKVRHHDRIPENGFKDSPAFGVALKLDGQSVVSAQDGTFEAKGSPASLVATLEGPHVNVVNRAGDDIVFSVELPATFVDGSSYLWEAQDDGEQAQLDAFIAVNTARDKAIAVTGGDLALFDEQMWVNVNEAADLDGDGQANDVCNAFYDGAQLHFLPAGRVYGNLECVNPAMVADIVYHEYGHAVHYYAVDFLEAMYAPDVSEGFADTLASSITQDPVIGPNFADQYAVRDLEPDKRWPEDGGGDPHEAGLIVGGALWDLRTLLRQELGDEQGNAVLDRIFGIAIRTTDSIPALYESTLLGDDDNGDLGDGTPHICSIIKAYVPHGLVEESEAGLRLAHQPLGNAEGEDAALRVEADLEVTAPTCVSLGQTRVVYSTDGGSTWKKVAMSSKDGARFGADLPALPAGTSLRYRIEADEKKNKTLAVLPRNPAEPYYQAYVGHLELIAFDDFESGEGGWTHELISGEERDGADDWQLGAPAGTGGDPVSAYSGENSWGNDLAPLDNWDGHYQPDIHNALISPAFDLGAYDNVRLQFRRWLNVEDGFFDRARILVGDEVVWENTATPGTENDPHNLHHNDEQWMLVDLDISAQAAGKKGVRIRFELQSDTGLHMGGWNIDDFALYTAKNPLAETDTGTDTANAITEQPEDTADDLAKSSASPDFKAMGGGCACAATGSGRRRGLWSTIFSLALP